MASAGRERHAVRHPGSELLETELVHPGFAAAVAFAVTVMPGPGA
jgi:hypothetical protein